MLNNNRKRERDIYAECFPSREYARNTYIRSNMYNSRDNSSAKLMDVPIIEPPANGCSNNRDSTIERVKALYILFHADLLRPLTLPTIATYILKRSNFEYTLLRTYTHGAHLSYARRRAVYRRCSSSSCSSSSSSNRTRSSSQIEREASLILCISSDVVRSTK